MFSAFLMDLDGTIIDSRKPFIITYNRVLVKHNLPPLPSDEDKAIRILRRPMEEIFPRLMGEGKSGDAAFVESFVEDLKEVYGELYLSNVKLCPHSRETIRRLRSLNLKIGVVSSRLAFADYIIPLLKNCGIGEMIDLVVTSKDVTASKPSPEPFLLAAKKLRSKVKECIVVGDSPEDLAAGKAAGMMTVAYTGGFYSLDELLKCDADIVIDDLTKLIYLAKARF